MAKKTIKRTLALLLALCMSMSVMSVSALAEGTDNTNGVRSTTITKYDSDGDPVGAGYGFNVYDEDLNLLVTAETDEYGSFNLADFDEVKEYFGFDDGNLHPADGSGKTVYIVDAESLSDPDAVIIPEDLLKDDGAYSSNGVKDQLKATEITIGETTVPAVSYTFTNFYHVNLGGWRLGNDRGDDQFTIRGNGDTAVAKGNWAYEWGVPIGTNRYFPTSGKTYYYQYSRENGVFSLKFDTDSDFEDCLSLSTELPDNALTYNYMLLWFRCPEGLTVTGTFGADGTFKCEGRDGDYYKQAFYPALFPLETVGGDFTVNGSVTFTYSDDFTYNKDGNEVVNFQFKGLYLPDCSAGFAPDPDVPQPPDENFQVKFNSGDASNISFLYLNKETGEVIFDHKIDIEDQTSFEITPREGYVSVVFVKQSTSGMIWIEEEVDDSELEAVAASIKANNPSYKGYDAVAFGEGDHDLTYKTGNGKKEKTNTVTYTFG